MKKKRTLYIAWAVLYALCAGLGFVPEPEGFVRFCLVVLALCFFLPPVLLLRQAIRQKEEKTVRLLWILSLVWLGLTAALLVLNFLSVSFTAREGLVVYVLLVLFTSPMICGQIWVLSMFLWACLMLTAWKHLPKKK